MKLISYKFNLNECKKFAKLIADNLEISDIILLNGDLGAGKTHLIKEICNNLDGKAYISSPSFGIYHQYKLKKLSIWHYDLYRLDGEISSDEVLNLDFEEAIANNAVIIEWAEKLKFEMNNYTLSIKIEYNADKMDERDYEISFLESAKWGKIFN